MDYQAIADDMAKTLVSYLTYQAVKVVAGHLSELDPPRGIWFRQFSSQTSIRDGEEYMRKLFAENPAIATRVLEVRTKLTEVLADQLPEMARRGVQESSIRQQRQYIERSLQVPVAEPRPDQPE